MSAATAAAQAALVAALRGEPGLAGVSGVHDAAPVRAVLPYLVVGETIAGDWSVKDARGREVRFQIVAWDEAGAAARLQALTAAIEHAAEGMARDLPGWRVASIVFVRSRIRRSGDGPWAGIVDYRIRMMEV